MIQKNTLLIVLLFLSAYSFAQEERLNDRNNINWLAYTGSFKLSDRFAVHTEYQWRRTDGFKNWQQGLFRTGLNYSLSKDVNLILGYAFAETFSYGDYPAAFAFPEHRMFEQLLIKNPLGSVNLSHRFMLEQRFVGSVSLQNGDKRTAYNYLNRMRYRAKAEIPLQKNNGANKWSLILQDEIFIGWGENIGANIFDQNRVGVLVGYKVNDLLKLEAGYINQTLQQGKRINNKPVFQHNNGLLLAANFSFDLRKK
jgi:hypothetical protein